MAFDVAVVEILASTIEENGVLPAKKLTVMKRGAVAIHANSQCLANRAGIVGKGDILGGEIIRIDGGGRRVKSADGLALGIGDAGVEIESEDGIGGVVADEFEKPFLALNVEQLMVGAGGDVDDDGRFPGAGGHGHDGFLHGLEFGAAIESDLQINPGGEQSTRNQARQQHGQPPAGQRVIGEHAGILFGTGKNQKQKYASR